MIKAFIDHLCNYFNFKGRTTRKDFWLVILCYFIIELVIFTITFNFPNLISIDYIFGLITLIPSLSLFVRRLHDTGHSGFWLLSYIIPPVGLCIIVYFCLLKSKTNNKYAN